jgi:hypothetical protein
MLCCTRFAAALLALATSSGPPALVEAGHPVRIRITARTRIVDGQTVTAVLVDPIYVHDRVAVSAGATVSGHLETLPGRRSREHVDAVAGGDLTPAVGARVHFDQLILPDDSPIPIAAVAAVDVDEPAPTTGEWVKDYLLTQLPYHPRYVHHGAVLTMTLVEPVTVAHTPEAQPDMPRGVPARLLTAVDTASAAAGDTVRAALLAPVRDADGHVIAPEGTIVTGSVTAVSHARLFGRGGHVTIKLDRLATTASRSENAIRFMWPPLATLALLGARDPADPNASTFWGRSGAGWSGFLVIGALVAQVSEPVALGLGVWGLAHTTWINVVRKGRDVVLPADSIVLLTTAA